MTTTTTTLPVMLFNTTGPIHLMGQLHAEGCTALRRAGRKVHLTRWLDEAEMLFDIADLEERGYPIRRCKCCK